MSEITAVTAFLGGLLALLSPCSALLLPAFFAYSFTTRTRLLLRTAVFYAGLCVTLVPLGVAGSFASRLFYGHRGTLVAVGGWTLIALGLAQILGLGFGSRRLQRAAGARRTGSALSVFALGAVYGLAGFCAGPILGGILTVAALDGSPLHGGLLLALYALGMAVPMFVLAVLWDRYDLGRRRWLRGRALRLGPLTVHSTSLVGGCVFVLLGAVFLLFDGTSALPTPPRCRHRGGVGTGGDAHRGGRLRPLPRPGGGPGRGRHGRGGRPAAAPADAAAQRGRGRLVPVAADSSP